MWPMDDSTMKSPPRNPAIVLAFAGDSTITSGLAPLREPRDGAADERDGGEEVTTVPSTVP